MTILLESIFWGLLTATMLLAFTRLQARLSWPLLNPMLMTLLCLAALLLAFGIGYERYAEHTRYFNALIEPAVVLFGFPLYRQLHAIGRYVWHLSGLCLLSVLFSLSVASLLAMLFGIEDWVIKSLVMVSTTTAIAMETSKTMGGSAVLAASMVLLGGLSGCAFGIYALTLVKVTDAKARGLAIGAFAHALGTATVARESQQSAAYSSTALVLCATFTAVIAPVYVPFLLGVY